MNGILNFINIYKMLLHKTKKPSKYIELHLKCITVEMQFKNLSWFFIAYLVNSSRCSMIEVVKFGY